MDNPDIDTRHFVFNEEERRSIEEANEELSGDKPLIDRLESISQAIPFYFPPDSTKEAILSRMMDDDKRRQCEQIVDETGLSYREIFDFAVQLSRYRRTYSFDLLNEYDEVYEITKDSLEHCVDSSNPATRNVELVFFSYTLHAFAFIEELSARLVTEEIFADEHPQGTVNAHVGNWDSNGHGTWRQSRRESLLKKYQIVDQGLLGDLKQIRRFRNQQVHDIFSRDYLKRKEGVHQLFSGLLDEIDRVVRRLFRFFTIPHEEIRRHGSEEWLRRQVDVEKDRLVPESGHQFILNHDHINYQNLYWEDYVNTDKNHDFSDAAADFSKLTDEEINGLDEFADSVNRGLEDRIVEQINWRPRRVSKRDLCLLILLEGDASYQKITDIIPTTTRYVKRKEGVLYNRISECNAEWLGVEQHPELPILEKQVDWFECDLRNPRYNNWNVRD